MRPSHVPLIPRLLVAPLLAAFSLATWAGPLSQGETTTTTLCLDTGHPRITRLCANVILRYKVDALMDVPLSNFGLTWTPISWTFSQLGGGSQTLPANKLPPALSRALEAATVQIKGTALADFSADAPLLYMQYQTNVAPAHDRKGWTGVVRAPMDRWLFTPGQCNDAPRTSLDPTHAMALYKLGVKSLSIDPRSSASVCKTGTVVTNLDQAARTVERICQAESSRTAPGMTSGLCLPPTAAGPVVRQAEDESARQRWGALLDEGVASAIPRPTLSMLDSPPPPSSGRAQLAATATTVTP